MRSDQRVRTVLRAIKHLCFLFLLCPCFTDSICAQPDDLQLVQPEHAGFDSAKLTEIDAIIEDGIATRKMPGCVLAIGRRSELVWLKAYGQRQVEPTAEPMTTDTVFDLASLTKPIATATSIMLLVERGKLRLNDQVAQHWPEFGVDKEDITIEHLMLHVGGLIADNNLADYLSGPEVAWKNIAGLKPLAPPHERFIYSDVGFLVLGHVVERVTGRSVADFARSEIFEPLAMRTTSYQPAPELRVRIAPTEKRSGQFIRGGVHDPRAHQLGGVAGHAGLFSTAQDLARYAAMMSQRGRWKGVTILRENTWEAMTRPCEVPRGRRSLGWDNYSPYSSNRGAWMSTMAFGHGGFTGTALWIDPESGLFVIFLSNRLHPDGKGAVNPIAGQIGTIASGAIIRR